MGYCPFWCDNCGIEQDNGWGKLQHLALLRPWISNLDIQIPTNSNNDFMEFIVCKECMRKLPTDDYDCSFLDDFELLSQA